MSLFVVHKSALHGQQFPCQTGKGNRMKHLQIYQGLPVWRMALDWLWAMYAMLFKVVNIKRFHANRYIILALVCNIPSSCDDFFCAISHLCEQEAVLNSCTVNFLVLSWNSESVINTRLQMNSSAGSSCFHGLWCFMEQEKAEKLQMRFLLCSVCWHSMVLVSCLLFSFSCLHSDVCCLHSLVCMHCIVWLPLPGGWS